MIQNYSDQLIKLTEYNLWANKRITSLIEGMDDELVLRKYNTSFASIKATVLHIWDAETIWRLRLTGNSIKDWPSKNFNGSIADLLKGFIQSSIQLKEHVTSIKKEDVNIIINYTNMKTEKFSSSLIDIITHCVNHSTFHRGQIITLMRLSGKTDLITTDYINFVRE